MLNETDILILYSVILSRNNKATIGDIKDVMEGFYPRLYNKPLPTYSYFYQRINRLRELFFLDKQGGRTYRIRREDYDKIREYVLTFIKTRFDLEDVKTG